MIYLIGETARETDPEFLDEFQHSTRGSAHIWSMYVPEVRCLSDEARMRIVD